MQQASWASSFARIDNNKKAIAEQGWGPMNVNCLLHPEIEATRHQGELGSDNSKRRIGHQDSVRGEAIPSEPSQHHVPAAELNLSQGLAGSLIDSILETRIRDDARTE